MVITSQEILLDFYDVPKNGKHYYVLKTYNLDSRKSYDYFVTQDLYKWLKQNELVLGDCVELSIQVSANRKYFNITKIEKLD